MCCLVDSIPPHPFPWLFAEKRSLLDVRRAFALPGSINRKLPLNWNGVRLLLSVPQFLQSWANPRLDAIMELVASPLSCPLTRIGAIDFVAISTSEKQSHEEQKQPYWHEIILSGKQSLLPLNQSSSAFCHRQGRFVFLWKRHSFLLDERKGRRETGESKHSHFSSGICEWECCSERPFLQKTGLNEKKFEPSSLYPLFGEITNSD